MSSSRFTFAAVSVAVATLITLTACGGGSSNSSTSSTASATTPVAVTVVDGLIRNAKVCVDSNNNNTCDAGEIQGTTDANGQVTIAVPTDSLTTVKIIAMVGTDAVDADNGAVTTPFTMTAATGSTAATSETTTSGTTTTSTTSTTSGTTTATTSTTATGTTAAAVVISPLTTMVQTKMETDKVNLQDAINYVKTQTGLTTSPLENFIAKRATSSEHKKAGDVARLLVLSMQKSKTSSTTCPNGTTKSSVEQDKEIAKNLSQKLGEVRRAHESNESDDDDSRKKVAPVVSGCGGSTPTTPTTTTTTATTSTTPTTTTTTGNTTTTSTGTTTTTASGTTTSTTTTSAANGKALYASSCASCHGATNTAMGINASATLRAIATNRGGMGALSSTIGAQQAADIAAYAANPSAVK